MRHLSRSALLGTVLLAAPLSAQVPEDYVDEPFLSGFTGPVGLVFDAAGEHMVVWERGGKVWIVDGGEKHDEPLLDISEEVGNWRDFGMLGFALDPDFLTNGYLYLYYVVDRHHLLYHGTPSYDPAANEYFAATIGRVTRYTADAATGFHTIVPESRLVLLGETPDSGVPILYESHGTGSLAFGEDGTLLVSSGDGASFNGTDGGSFQGTYWVQALADGIIRPAENVGAFRSQMIGSHNGKILRLDPATGDGLSSNPFYDPNAPRSPRSRVWALGLRNPFRMLVRPGTGDPDPAAGRPGTIYVGDVGYNTWEDLHVVGEPGENLGWPLFEGLVRQLGYKTLLTANLDAPNPLYGQSGCDIEYFRFQDLIEQENANHDFDLPNPCDGSQLIPPSTPTFMHTRPVLDWRHGQAVARVPLFELDGTPTRAVLGTPECPVAGDPFPGNCSVGGFWHSGLGLGAPYAGSYFHMDFSGWIRALRLGDEDDLLEVLSFGSVPAPVYAAEDPADGSILYVTLAGDQIRRIRWLGAGNAAPQARLDASGTYGPAPLEVRFDATGSIDPEKALLTFAWDFGDGHTSVAPSPVHTFAGTGSPLVVPVTLTVGDPDGALDTTELHVVVDDTPPQVAITSFANGATYSTTDPTMLLLDATATDAESDLSELSWAWQLFLHHDSHEHPEDVLTEQTTSVELTPTPCNGPFYAYRVVLTVTDPQGLATTVEQWLFPDCQVGTTVQLVTPRPDTQVGVGEAVTLNAVPAGPAQRVDFRAGGTLVGTSFGPPWMVEWTPEVPGTFALSALVETPEGLTAVSPGVPLEVLPPTRVEERVSAQADDAEERGAAEGGAMELAGGALQLGLDGAIPQVVGLRFPLDVPAHARILWATLQFTADRVDEGKARFEIRAEATPDAAPIGAAAHDLSSRATTAAAVTWKPAPWSYEHAAGEAQRTPDLSAIVQELVDDPGFSQGNSALFLIRGFGQRTAESFKPGNPRGALLVVEYAD